MKHCKLALTSAIAAMALGMQAAHGHGSSEPYHVNCGVEYWQNNTSVWFGNCCTKGSECDQMLNKLSAKGPRSEDVRGEAQAYLNSCYSFVGSPCEEADED